MRSYEYRLINRITLLRLELVLEASSDDLARLELERRLARLGIAPDELPDWVISSTVVNKGPR